VKSGAEKRLLAVWALLCAITLAQAGVDSFGGPSASLPNGVIAAGAIAVALVKVRIILSEFMEVRHAPASLRRLTDLWVVSTGVVLVASYVIGLALADR